MQEKYRNETTPTLMKRFGSGSANIRFSGVTGRASGFEKRFTLRRIGFCRRHLR